MEPDFISTWLPVAAKAKGITFVPANNSGILPTLNYIKEFHPDLLTPERIAWLGAELPNIVGAYPQNNYEEKALCNFYTVAHFLLFAGATFVFALGYKRGQFFWPLLMVCTYCLFSAIGFICRRNWAQDLSDMHVGMASVVLCQFGEYLLVFCSLIFADRLCSWRSPRKTWSFNIFTAFYGIGIVSYIISSIGQIYPYYYFLTGTQLTSFQSLMMVGSVLEIIIALLPFPLVYLLAILGWNARLLGGGRHSEKHDPIYQADWIENANIFSYPIPIHRPINRQLYPQVSRVIPTYELPAGGKLKILSKPMLPGSPSVLFAHLIVIVSSLCLATAPMVRILSNTLTNSKTSEYVQSTEPLMMGHTYFPQSPTALWVFFGGIQMCVIVGWLLLRVDLRFYLPPVYSRNGVCTPTKGQKLYEAFA